MRFDPKKNPAGIVADACDRYSVTGVAAVALGGEHYLASTDGRALLLVAAEPSPDDAIDGARVYPAEAIAASRRKAFGAVVLAADGATVPGVASYPALPERFPSIDGIVPTGEPERVFCLDAERLAKLQRALGAAGVRIEWHGDTCPMVVQPVAFEPKRRGKARRSDPATIDGSFGVLMPISGEGGKP